MAITERRSKADIDRLAEALGRAVAEIGGRDELLPDSGNKSSTAEEIAR